MYSYDHHTNIPWNVTQYEVPVLHNDYKQIMRIGSMHPRRKVWKSTSLCHQTRVLHGLWTQSSQGRPASGTMHCIQSIILIRNLGMILSILSRASYWRKRGLQRSTLILKDQKRRRNGLENERSTYTGALRWNQQNSEKTSPKRSAMERRDISMRTHRIWAREFQGQDFTILTMK